MVLIWSVMQIACCKALWDLGTAIIEEGEMIGLKMGKEKSSILQLLGALALEPGF